MGLPKLPSLELRTMEEVAVEFRMKRRSFQGFLARVEADHPDAELYRCVGRRKLFSPENVRMIWGLACPSNLSRSDNGTATRSGMPVSPSRGTDLKSARTRQTKALLSDLQNEPSAKCTSVTSLAVARQKRSRKQSRAI